MKRFAILTISVLLVLTLGACTRSKTADVVKTPTLPAVAPFPVVTQPTPEVNSLSVTQTALSSAFTNPTATPVMLATMLATPTAPDAAAVGTGGVVVASAAPLEPAVSPTPEGTLATPLFEVFSGTNYGYPTFGVRGVVQDANVTLQLNEFPPDVHYIIKMGPIDTAAVNGTVAYEGDSGTGGSSVQTITIPEQLKGQPSIAVRIEFSSGTWAANYFYNITTR